MGIEPNGEPSSAPHNHSEAPSLDAGFPRKIREIREDDFIKEFQAGLDQSCLKSAITVQDYLASRAGDIDVSVAIAARAMRAFAARYPCEVEVAGVEQISRDRWLPLADIAVIKDLLAPLPAHVKISIVLETSEFCAPLYQLTSFDPATINQLERVSSDPRYANGFEANRIYRVFRPFEYYKYWAEEAIKAKQEDGAIEIFRIMALSELSNPERLEYTVRRIVELADGPAANELRRPAENALAQLLAASPRPILELLRGELGKRNSLSEAHAMIVDVICLHGSPAGGDLVLEILLQRGLAHSSRQRILRTIQLGYASLPGGLNQYLSPIAAEGVEATGEALQYLKGAIGFGKQLWGKDSSRILGEALSDVGATLESLQTARENFGSHIPADVFVWAYRACKGDLGLLQQVDALYQRFSAPAGENFEDRSELSHVLAIGAGISQEPLRDFFVGWLEHALRKEGGGSTGELLEVARYLHYFSLYNRGLLPEHMTALPSFDRERPQESCRLLRDCAVDLLTQNFTYSGYDTPDFRTIERLWGSVSPIVAYQCGILTSTRDLDFFMEVLAKFDSEDYSKWREYRYGLHRQEVWHQLRGKTLLQSQFFAWVNNPCEYVANSAVAGSQQSVPEQILSAVIRAAEDGHIAGGNNLDSSRRTIQTRLISIIRSFQGSEDRARVIADHYHALLEEPPSYEVEVLQSLVRVCLECAEETRPAFSEFRKNSIIDSLKRVRNYFDDNFMLAQLSDGLASDARLNVPRTFPKRYLMLATDHPQMLFNIGKYPLGSRSCQRYDGDPYYNCALLGYVADAHTKAVFMIDADRLSVASQAALAQSDLASALSQIPISDLLQASVARKIMKYNQESTFLDNPVIVLGPLYPPMGSHEAQYNKIFQDFVARAVSRPCQASLADGPGEDSVWVPASRNPAGQCEIYDGREWTPTFRGPGYIKVRIIERGPSSPYISAMYKNRKQGCESEVAGNDPDATSQNS